MASLRSLNRLGLCLRTTPLAPISLNKRYSQSAYGGTEGDPRASKPKEQGPSPSENLEHPGPSPPSTGSKPSSSNNKGLTEEGGFSGRAEADHRGPKNGAKPRILDSAPPAEESEDVREHNKHFENRHDRAANKIDPEGKDKVGKGFWTGQGGVDKDP